MLVKDNYSKDKILSCPYSNLHTFQVSVKGSYITLSSR